MSKHAIRAMDIRVGYRGTTLIEEDCVTLPAGRISVLLGANGCGKSTLLKALAGLHPVQGGRVWIGDEELATTPARRLARRLAFLPQHPAAPETLTVAELVMMGRYPYRRPLLPSSAGDRAAVAQALAQTDLSDLAQRPLGGLSGGQRQRAWLAMVLAQQTDILLLDEPTSYLDLSHQYDLLNLIRRLNREQGKTVVLVLHDLNQAFEFADQLIYMKEGNIHAQGSPAETVTPGLIKTIFGLSCDIQPHPHSACPLLIPLAGDQGAPRPALPTQPGQLE